MLSTLLSILSFLRLLFALFFGGFASFTGGIWSSSRNVIGRDVSPFTSFLIGAGVGSCSFLLAAMTAVFCAVPTAFLSRASPLLWLTCLVSFSGCHLQTVQGPGPFNRGLHRFLVIDECWLIVWIKEAAVFWAVLLILVILVSRLISRWIWQHRQFLFNCRPLLRRLTFWRLFSPTPNLLSVTMDLQIFIYSRFTFIAWQISQGRWLRAARGPDTILPTAGFLPIPEVEERLSVRSLDTRTRMLHGLGSGQSCGLRTEQISAHLFPSGLRESLHPFCGLLGWRPPSLLWFNWAPGWVSSSWTGSSQYPFCDLLGWRLPWCSEVQPLNSLPRWTDYYCWDVLSLWTSIWAISFFMGFPYWSWRTFVLSLVDRPVPILISPGPPFPWPNRAPGWVGSSWTGFSLNWIS
ncbi:hypothetical protein V6N13_027415 [Hibiscus sabdariffa]